jgi:hypothetical protein
MTTLEILEKLVSFPTMSRDLNRDLVEFVRSILAERNKGKIARACGTKATTCPIPPCAWIELKVVRL